MEGFQLAIKTTAAVRLETDDCLEGKDDGCLGAQRALQGCVEA